MAIATVTLSLAGRRLDPQQVTDATGQTPTDAHRAMDPMLRRKYGDRIWRMGMWDLSAKDVTIDNVLIVVNQFVALIQRSGGLSAIEGVESAQIAIGLFDLRGTGESINFSSQILTDLGTVGLSLMVDAYGNSPTGPVERERNDLGGQVG